MSAGEQRMIKAAGLIMTAMITSRILGYIRDIVIYAHFGQNRMTDVYNAAFFIPDFLYLLLVGGALSSAFIPVFSGYVATGREEEGWEVASIILNTIVLLMLVGITLGVIFTPQLVRLLVPGFDAQSLAFTVKLTRLMFIQAFFMGLNGIAMGILNSYKHFFSPALGSVLYNLGIILVGILLIGSLGIMGFSIGAVVGAMAQFAVQVPALFKRGLRYRLILNWKHPGVVRVARLILPVLIGLSIIQLNLFVVQHLASTLSPGAVTALLTGQRLMQVPIGIFAVAIAVAVFPTMTGQATAGEIKEFQRTLSLGIRSVVFTNLPAAAGLIALSVPIVRLLFEQGKFTPAATLATAGTLSYYSIGIVAYASIQVLNRGFYAMQDTRTPVTVGAATIILNIVLNFALIGVLQEQGLALAYSIAGLFNMLLLLWILRSKLGTMDGTRLLKSSGNTLLASVLMGLTSYAIATQLARYLDLSMKLSQFIQVGAGVTAGLAVFVILSTVFRMEEMHLVREMLGRRFRTRSTN